MAHPCAHGVRDARPPIPAPPQLSYLHGDGGGGEPAGRRQRGLRS